MEEQTLLDLLYQSMQDSAREARLSLGRPSSWATREEALQQVAMLKAAKEAVSQLPLASRTSGTSWWITDKNKELSLNVGSL